MPSVSYIIKDASVHTYDLRIGQSVMEGAARNGVPGILAECGGSCMCATCHVYVEARGDALPPLGRDEDEMLDETAGERRDNSRLACQIRMTDSLDGLVVRIADNH